MALHYKELSQLYDGVPLNKWHMDCLCLGSLWPSLEKPRVLEVMSVFTIFHLVIKLSNYQYMSEVILYIWYNVLTGNGSTSGIKELSA